MEICADKAESSSDSADGRDLPEILELFDPVEQHGSAERFMAKSPWAKLRRLSDLFADGYAALGMAETSLAIRNCGRFVEFACYAIGDQEEPLRRVAKVWYCRKRLCALCQWRNARWQQRQLSELVQNYQVAHPEEGAAMLSLTVPRSANCSATRR
jgi:hypothetical protein